MLIKRLCATNFLRVSACRSFSKEVTKPNSDEKTEIETFKQVDNRPKHLLHMTNEDFQAPDPELIGSEMKELIKEARSKIKPVLKAMSDEELDSIIITLEEAKKDKQIIIFDQRWNDVMSQLGVTLEELRRIQDKHYEVDIEYELTRDLYEKQRVRDLYLEEHQEDNQLLNQYFSNQYYKAKENKQPSIVYMLPFNPIELRFNYRMMWFTTGLAATALSFIHPALTFVLSYDLYLLLKGTKVMNQTCNLIILQHNKRYIELSKLNFLGYAPATTATRVVNLRDVKYLGEYENTAINLQNMGLLPSMARYFKRSENEAKKAVEQGDDDNGDFRRFHKFMAGNEMYLVNVDHPRQDDFMVSEQLLLDVIMGKQNKVLEYDYTEDQQKMQEAADKVSEEIREILAFKQVAVYDEIQQTKRAYQYYHPNREFSGKQEQSKLKVVDDGTFIDNGYR